MQLPPLPWAFFGFFLWSFRRNLRRLYSNEVLLQDYKKTRLEYDRLNKIFEKAGDRNFKGLIKRSPWLLRGSLRIAQDIFDLIHRRRDAIGRILSQLDAADPRTDLLQAVSEKDLWASRAKIYDYRF